MKHLLLYLLLSASLTVFGQMPGKARWIAATEDTSVRPAPLFRKVFRIAWPVKKAELYVCGVGYEQTTVNGIAISDAVLQQAFTRYDKRILYDTYNVTQLIKPGTNQINVELGNGWYNVQSLTIWNFDKIGWRKSPRLLANLVIEYQNGSQDTIASDQSWQSTTGPDRFNSMAAGEIYDARIKPNNWHSAIITESAGGTLEPNRMPPVRIIRKIKPVAIKLLAKGQYLYDMGQNFAGVVQLKVQGHTGDSVKLEYAERLDSTGHADMQQNASQMMGPDTDPKFATDTYILKGESIETWSPRFTYHGFRYVQVTTKTARPVLTGLFYSTDFKAAGTFKSSDSMLNKLYAAAIQSYRSNFIGIPTDCPQREKMGWLADAWLACDLGLWNFDTNSGYREYLRDIRDVQLSDGKLPGVTPTNGIGYRWIDPKDDDFGPGWGSALPQITWRVYLHTGDTGIIKENYMAVQRYVDYLTARARKTGYMYTTGLGDWMAVEETPKALISTLLYYADLKLLSKMADVLGRTGAAQQNLALADSVQKTFIQEFMDNGEPKIKTVTALSGMLYQHICPENDRPKIVKELLALLKKKDYQIDFGVMGSKYILDALSDNGYADIAYRLLTGTGSGWAKWIKDGATTLFEDWEGKGSHNHVYFGNFAAWYYRGLAGIKTDENRPGFRHFLIIPVFPAGLSRLAVSHRTRYGTIALNWQRKGKHLVIDIAIPAGTTASVSIPGKGIQQLHAGRYQFSARARAG